MTNTMPKGTKNWSTISQARKPIWALLATKRSLLLYFSLQYLSFATPLHMHVPVHVCCAFVASFLHHQCVLWARLFSTWINESLRTQRSVDNMTGERSDILRPPTSAHTQYTQLIRITHVCGRPQREGKIRTVKKVWPLSLCHSPRALRLPCNRLTRASHYYSSFITITYYTLVSASVHSKTPASPASLRTGFLTSA